VLLAPRTGVVTLASPARLLPIPDIEEATLLEVLGSLGVGGNFDLTEQGLAVE
jgi:hypothetical protein